MSFIHLSLYCIYVCSLDKCRVPQSNHNTPWSKVHGETWREVHWTDSGCQKEGWSNSGEDKAPASCRKGMYRCFVNSHWLNGWTEQVLLIIVTVFMQDTDIGTRREIALKCLIINMRESMDDLVQEFLVRQDYCTGVMLAKTVHLIWVFTNALYIQQSGYILFKLKSETLVRRNSVIHPHLLHNLPGFPRVMEFLEYHGSLKSIFHVESQGICLLQCHLADAFIQSVVHLEFIQHKQGSH